MVTAGAAPEEINVHLPVANGGDISSCWRSRRELQPPPNLPGYCAKSPFTRKNPLTTTISREQGSGRAGSPLTRSNTRENLGRVQFCRKFACAPKNPGK
jgi:hypothetical protein